MSALTMGTNALVRGTKEGTQAVVRFFHPSAKPEGRESPTVLQMDTGHEAPTRGKSYLLIAHS